MAWCCGWLVATSTSRPPLRSRQRSKASVSSPLPSRRKAPHEGVATQSSSVIVAVCVSRRSFAPLDAPEDSPVQRAAVRHRRKFPTSVPVTLLQKSDLLIFSIARRRIPQKIIFRTALVCCFTTGEHRLHDRQPVHLRRHVSEFGRCMMSNIARFVGILQGSSCSHFPRCRVRFVGRHGSAPTSRSTSTRRRRSPRRSSPRRRSLSKKQVNNRAAGNVHKWLRV